MGHCSGEDDKGGSARAEKWKRKFGGVETGKDSLWWEMVGASSKFFSFNFSEFFNFFKFRKSDIKLKVRRVAVGSKDSAIATVAVVGQKEVTHTSKRGR